MRTGKFIVSKEFSLDLDNIEFHLLNMENKFIEKEDHDVKIGRVIIIEEEDYVDLEEFQIEKCSNFNDYLINNGYLTPMAEYRKQRIEEIIG